MAFFHYLSHKNKGLSVASKVFDEVWLNCNFKACWHLTMGDRSDFLLIMPNQNLGNCLVESSRVITRVLGSSRSNNQLKLVIYCL